MIFTGNFWRAEHVIIPPAMLINLLFTNPLLFVALFAALTLALSLHEFAHAYVAVWQGDPTPKYAGRLTLNPLAHLDPSGTFLLLVAGFGWAKPVPVNPLNMRNPKRGSTLVSIAGPGMNFVLAVVSAILLKALSFIGGLPALFLYYFAFYNLGLGIFNLLPVNPLDGFKFVRGILPEYLAVQWQQLAPYGMFILLFLVLSGSLDRIMNPLLGLFSRILGL